MILPGHSFTSHHAGIFSKSSGGRLTDAQATNCPYSSLQNDLEHEIAARPSLGDGHTLRFSVCLIPDRIRIAYGPVQVKALTSIFSKAKAYHRLLIHVAHPYSIPLFSLPIRIKPLPLGAPISLRLLCVICKFSKVHMKRIDSFTIKFV